MDCSRLSTAFNHAIFNRYFILGILVSICLIFLTWYILEMFISVVIFVCVFMFSYTMNSINHSLKYASFSISFYSTVIVFVAIINNKLYTTVLCPIFILLIYSVYITIIYHRYTIHIPYTSYTERCDENCTICLELMNRQNVVRMNTCSHLFHETCINEWLIRSHSCPNCRVSVV